MISTPRSASEVLTAGSASAPASARLSVAITSVGVCAGATSPCQVVASKFLIPSSSMVGMSGSTAVRLRLATASARTWPSLICGTTDEAVANIICTCPAITSCSAGAAPLYGTCTMSTLASALNSSPARCAARPWPEEAKLSLPGLALVSAISSLMDLAGGARAVVDHDRLAEDLLELAGENAREHVARPARRVSNDQRHRPRRIIRRRGGGRAAREQREGDAEDRQSRQHRSSAALDELHGDAAERAEVGVQRVA